MLKSALVHLGESLGRRPETGALIATLLVFVLFSLWGENFLTLVPITTMLIMATELGIVAIGITLLMIAGEFDLSVGSVLALSGVLVIFMINAGVPSWLAVVVMLIGGGAIGLLQGLVVVKVGIPSFIVTLAGMMLLRGILFVSVQGFLVPVVTPDDAFLQIFSHRFENGANISIVWFLGLVVILTLILQRTRFGNWIFATGGNKRAARELGVPVNRVKLLLFGLSSAMASLAGIIQTTRLMGVDPLRGQQVEFQAIAAAAIGGTLLFGGYGSVVGTVLGVSMLAMIKSGLFLAQVPGYWFLAFVGLLILMAVIINTTAQGRSLGIRAEE